MNKVIGDPSFVPVDKQAALVIGKGEQPLKSNDPNLFVAPPLMRPVPSGYRCNLTGLRVGKLEVIGLVAARRTNKQQYRRAKARRVVRCRCGYYTIRSTKALRSPPKGRTVQCSYCDRNTFSDRK